VFIQINLDQDDRSPNRSGIEAQSLGAMVDELLLLENVKVVGIMGIGPLGQDPEPGFELLNRLSITLRKTIPDAAWISAGMSGDFQTAIAHGATHVRIGSSILGSR
jgi:uncharacterized pyridoxal phosphate-containing UPF0001 family protein